MNTSEYKPWFKYPSNPMGYNKALVVGGGISGVSIAYHLSLKGWQVSIYDEKDTNQASNRDVAILYPKFDRTSNLQSDFYFEALDYLVNLIKSNKMDHEIDFDMCGIIKLVKDNFTQEGFTHEHIKFVSESEIEHISGINIKSKALHLPQSGKLNMHKFCNQLLSRVNIKRNNIKVTSFTNFNQKWQIWNYNNQIDEADVLIIANSFECKKFEVLNFLNLEEIAGQTDSFCSSNIKLKSIVCGQCYIVPGNKLYHIGATFEKPNLSLENSIRSTLKNLINASCMLPNLKIDNLNSFMTSRGIRSYSYDKMPIIGMVPDIGFYQDEYYDIHLGNKSKVYRSAKYHNGLYISIAHGSRGLLSGTLGGKIICDLINNQMQNQKILSIIHPARFIIKNLKRRINF